VKKTDQNFKKTDRFGSVRFRFYKPKTEPKPNRKNPEKIKPNQKKPSQTEKLEPNRKNRVKTKPNRFELIFILKNRTKTDQFQFDFSFLKKKFRFGYFFDKNRTELKMTTLLNSDKIRDFC